jgi:hypothetical protein
MREQLGDPEDVVDRDGFFPAQRREMNLSSHMSFWRHPMLRGLHESKQRKRFNALLAMRPVDSAASRAFANSPAGSPPLLARWRSSRARLNEM